MYEYKQHKRRNYIHHERYQFCFRRLIIVLCSIIVLYLLIHLIQTGIFLIEHFYEIEDTNDLIKLDMNIFGKRMKD
jgi:hypothetical protein